MNLQFVRTNMSITDLINSCHFTCLNYIIDELDLEYSPCRCVDDMRPLVLENVSEEDYDWVKEIIDKENEYLRKRGVLCKNKDCTKLAKYKTHGVINGEYCIDHKKEGMVEI